MPIRPWLRCHPTREAPQLPPSPQPRVTRGPSPGGIAHTVLTAPSQLQGRRGAQEGRDGPPCLRGGPRAGGHKAGLLPLQHNREGRGGLAQVSSGLRSQDPASYSLSGSPDPLAVPTQRARAPARRQAPPPNSPPLSGEARSGESAGLSLGTP